MPEALSVALLRGINVGRAKRIPMADLCALVTALGYTDVRTLLNSGNVVFGGASARRRGRRETPQQASARLEAAIVERFGFTSRVTVLGARELDAIMNDNPFLADVEGAPSRFLVAVTRGTAELERLRPLAEHWSPDSFALGRRAAYLWCAGGIIESRLLEAVGRALGEDVTTRNWATMAKLHALVGKLRSDVEAQPRS